MEDLSKDGEHVSEILSLTEQLYEKLKNTPDQMLTREQVVAHLGGSAGRYYHVVEALALIKKINKRTGRTGGIALRTGSGIRPEILPCNREQLQRYFSRLRGSENAVDATDGEKKTERIRRKAIEILGECPQGIVFSEWRRQIKAALPGANNNTIGGVIWDLDVKEPQSVLKPGKGLFLHAKYRDSVAVAGPKLRHPNGTEVDDVKTRGKRIKESDFYKPFADWLVEELEECSKAIPVGGNLFKDKWGTPDVIGIREPKKSDIIKLPTEIVSAEMKLDAMGLITAFGQACAYRLFSHKSYIVVPDSSQEEDIARLDALSRIFGVGLILFNPEDSGDPDFSIRVRAAKHDPDMFYVNRCMRIIEDELFG